MTAAFVMPRVQGVRAVLALRHGLVWHARPPVAGEVEWNFQRTAAHQAIRYLAGVTGVTNDITLMAHPTVSAVKEKVEQALQRQATKDASTIHVDTAGGTVTLTGNASSWHAIEEAAAAAWAAPGVTKVVDTVSMNGY